MPAFVWFVWLSDCSSLFTNFDPVELSTYATLPWLTFPVLMGCCSGSYHSFTLVSPNPKWGHTCSSCFSLHAIGNARVKATGEVVMESWEKMSKSKLNGVDPSEVFARHGVELTRLTMLASVGPHAARQWNEGESMSATFLLPLPLMCIAILYN